MTYYEASDVGPYGMSPDGDEYVRYVVLKVSGKATAERPLSHGESVILAVRATVTSINFKRDGNANLVREHSLRIDSMFEPPSDMLGEAIVQMLLSDADDDQIPGQLRLDDVDDDTDTDL